MISKVFSVLAIATFVSAGYIGNIANNYNGNLGGGASSYANSELRSYGNYPNQWANDNKDTYAYPKYQFNYNVNDPETGDEKSQQEERDGDVVRGHYSLKESDGTTRSVQYQADSQNGFNAIVSRSGVAHHPANANYQRYNNYQNAGSNQWDNLNNNAWARNQGLVRKYGSISQSW